ncbi:MAG: hypothetical protein U1E29_18465 [Coriobacteriia bacterium]|nr:hypothetical protein [Coriobacteriia bacterium]
MSSDAQETPVRVEIPRFNWGAFLIAPIWGMAHGQWWGVFFLPAWAFVDNMLRGPRLWGPWTTVIGIGMAAATIGLQALYAASADRLAVRRLEDREAFDRYVRQQRAWAIGGAVVFLGMVVWIALFIALGGAPID